MARISIIRANTAFPKLYVRFFFLFLFGCVILWIKFLALRRSVCWLHCCMYLGLIKSAKQTVPRSLLSTELGNKARVTVKHLKIVRNQTETSRLWYLWNFRKVVCITFCRGNIFLSIKIFIFMTRFRFIYFSKTLLFVESVIKIIKYTGRLCVR